MKATERIHHVIIFTGVYRWTWASLIAQLVNSLPTMQETPVQFLDQEEGRRDRLLTPVFLGFLGGSHGKESACNAGDVGSTLGWEDTLEEGMATHSSILAWRIPWTEEPGSQRIGNNWATKHSTAVQMYTANPTRILTCRSITIERQPERAPVILTIISECQSSPSLIQEAHPSDLYCGFSTSQL